MSVKIVKRDCKEWVKIAWRPLSDGKRNVFSTHTLLLFFFFFMKKLLAYSWIFLLSVAPLTQNALALESVNNTQSVSAGTSDTVGRVTLPSPAQPKYVPYTVYMVPLASVALSAPNTSDLTVTELVFQPRFASGTSVGPIKIDKIYLSKDGKNIASTTTLLSENTYSVKLKEAYTLSRGASVVFDVTLGQMDAQKNQQITVFLQSVWANIPVSWTPTTLGIFATTSYQISSLTLGKYSSGVTLTPGDMRVIAPIELTAQKYDVTVSRIVLTDTWDNNLKNTFAKPSLWDASTNKMIVEGKIAENAIVFDALNIKATRYNTSKYQVRANILGSGASSNFSFSMKHDNNLVAIEDSTGYRVPINGEDDYRSYVKVISSGSTKPPTTPTKPISTLTVSAVWQMSDQYVPQNALLVSQWKIQLSTTKDTYLKSITFYRSWTGKPETLSEVHLWYKREWDRNYIASSKSEYNPKNQKATVHFENDGKWYFLKAWYPYTFDVFATFSGESLGTHTLSVESLQTDLGENKLTSPVQLWHTSTTSYKITTPEISVDGGQFSLVKTDSIDKKQKIAKISIKNPSSQTLYLRAFTLNYSVSPESVTIDPSSINGDKSMFIGEYLLINGNPVGTLSQVVNGDPFGTLSQNLRWFSYTKTQYPIELPPWVVTEVYVGWVVNPKANIPQWTKLTLTIGKETNFYITELSTWYETGLKWYDKYRAVSVFDTVNPPPSTPVVSGEVSFTAKKWQNTAKKWQSATFFEWKILTKSDQTIRELVITPALFGARGIQDFQDGKLSVRINGAEIATINRLDSTIKIPVNIITSKNVPLILTITGTPKNEKQVRWAYQFAVKLAQVYSAWVVLKWDKKAVWYKTTIRK